MFLLLNHRVDILNKNLKISSTFLELEIQLPIFGCRVTRAFKRGGKSFGRKQSVSKKVSLLTAKAFSKKKKVLARKIQSVKKLSLLAGKSLSKKKKKNQSLLAGKKSALLAEVC